MQLLELSEGGGAVWGRVGSVGFGWLWGFFCVLLVEVSKFCLTKQEIKVTT